MSVCVCVCVLLPFLLLQGDYQRLGVMHCLSGRGCCWTAWPATNQLQLHTIQLLDDLG